MSVCENVHNTSNTLTYENALKYRTKDIKKYCEKFDDAIREMMHENKKMLYFFTDSVILTNLLKGVTEFVFSPKEATKKFVDDMMNKCLSNKFQILINRLSEIKGSKFQIMLLFFVIIKEEDEKNKELYFNHIDKYLLPAYVELKGFPYVDGYRDMFNVYLSQGDIEFCKMAWLISYDFCYKFFFETKAEMNDVLLQECLLRVFKDLVIKNVYGVEEKGFSKFVFYFNGACGALKIPMLNWNGDNVNCKNIFDYLVVHNKISSLTFEDDET